jgi:hypothetical protein
MSVRSWRYLRSGGRGQCVGAEKTRRQPVLDGQSREKCLKTATNPRRPAGSAPTLVAGVHAVLGGAHSLQRYNAVGPS